ncbi:hypothetical protein MESMUL_20320 [Mesosutterella multiformis]|uniref:Uncharacterized protein n=1 Tax=Mesosutterella multiformis TaxID=2259133 RepID=A0A388SEG2_9BURK|nr:hypothetical protein MESMUL_20320 [Mesosutterella multiformis]
MILEHHGNAALMRREKKVSMGIREQAVSESQKPFRRSDQTGNQLRKRGLPRAALPHDSGDT